MDEIQLAHRNASIVASIILDDENERLELCARLIEAVVQTAAAKIQEKVGISEEPARYVAEVAMLHRLNEKSGGAGCFDQLLTQMEDMRRKLASQA